jgi:membrane peptidoglycan carboxypeptidase
VAGVNEGTGSSTATRVRPGFRERLARRLNYPRQGKTGAGRWVPSLRLVGLVVGVVLLAVIVLLGIAYAATPIPDPDDAAQAQTSTVFFADEQTPLGSYAAFERRSVPLDQVAEPVQQAVIASEDSSFYENQGIDPRGIVRAFWNNLRGGETQGASTLTQQYVERYFLGSSSTYWSKFREAIIALKIDQVESKEQILENYLNTIYFGRSSYGIERAAQTYFGKSAADLSLSEAALLAGIIPAPNAWDPRVDPERAEARWERVLTRMAEDGYITQEERDAAEFPQTVEFVRTNRLAGPQGYLLEMVREELAAHGFSTDQLDQGGLQIVSTINQARQQAAVEAVDSLPDSRPENNRVALVSVAPESGALQAVYAGPDFVTMPRNAVTQDRAQAGSTFKPFTLIAALENGYTLEDRFPSHTPMEIPGFDRPVRNFDTINRGRINLIRATANSVNTVYARLNVEVGPERTVDVAVRAGIPEDTPGLGPFPSNVLGPASPHPIDLVQSFATIANSGIRNEPYIVSTVRNSAGEVLYQAQLRGEQVIFPQVAADATYAMTQVVDGGTARTASRLGRPAAGKTGTSQDNKSALFCGFIPQIATCVAMYQVGPDGSEEPLTPFGGVNPIAGGTYPTTVWTRYMFDAVDGLDVLDFPARSRPTFTPEPEPEPTLTREPTATPTETATAEPTGTPTATQGGA